MPTDTEVSLSDSLTLQQDDLLADLFCDPVADRTALLIVDKQIELTRLTRKSIRQAYQPTLSGFGQLYYQGQRNKFDFLRGGDDKFFKVGVVGIHLNISLFDGLEKRARIKQYDLELEQLNNARENRLAYFSKELVDAIHQYKNGLNILHRQEKNVAVAEESFDISLQGYRQQVVPLSDLLMSENELTEAHLSYSNALMQLKNAQLELRKVKGKLLLFVETNQ
jgi:outer membrane protein TolC